MFDPFLFSIICVFPLLLSLLTYLCLSYLSLPSFSFFFYFCLISFTFYFLLSHFLTVLSIESFFPRGYSCWYLFLNYVLNNSFLSSIHSLSIATSYLTIFSISDLYCSFKVSIVSLTSFLSFSYYMLQFSSALCPYFLSAILRLSHDYFFVIIFFLAITLLY